MLYDAQIGWLGLAEAWTGGDSSRPQRHQQLQEVSNSRAPRSVQAAFCCSVKPQPQLQQGQSRQESAHATSATSSSNELAHPALLEFLGLLKPSLTLLRVVLCCVCSCRTQHDYSTSKGTTYYSTDYSLPTTELPSSDT